MPSVVTEQKPDQQTSRNKASFAQPRIGLVKSATARPFQITEIVASNVRLGLITHVTDQKLQLMPSEGRCRFTAVDVRDPTQLLDNVPFHVTSYRY